MCSVGIASSGVPILALIPRDRHDLARRVDAKWLEKESRRTASGHQRTRPPYRRAASRWRRRTSLYGDAGSSNAAWYLGWQEWALKLENRYLPKDPFQTICCIMGLLIVSTLVKHLLMLSSDLLIGQCIYQHCSRAQAAVFEIRPCIWIVARINILNERMMAAITSAADGLATGLMALFGAAVREPLRIEACLIGACIINWRLLLLSVVLAPLLIMVVVYFNRKIRAVASTIIGRNAGFHEVLLEALITSSPYKPLPWERAEKARFAEAPRHAADQPQDDSLHGIE